MEVHLEKREVFSKGEPEICLFCKKSEAERKERRKGRREGEREREQG